MVRNELHFCVDLTPGFAGRQAHPPGYRQENHPLSTPRGEGVNKFVASKFVGG